MLILQFWRNLGPEKMDLPIAFCNPASIDTASLRFLPVEDYAGSGTFFETIGIESNNVDNHDWRYFPEMNKMRWWYLERLIQPVRPRIYQTGPHIQRFETQR